MRSGWLLSAMPRPVLPPLHATLSRTERHHLAEWYIAWALIVFAVPLIGAGLLELHHDLYLLIYFTVMGTFLASFVAHTHLDWRGWLPTRLWWSIAAGAVVGFAIVRNVFSEASMAHPSGSSTGSNWLGAEALRDRRRVVVVRVPGDGGLPAAP